MIVLFTARVGDEMSIVERKAQRSTLGLRCFASGQRRRKRIDRSIYILADLLTISMLAGKGCC